MVKFFKKNFTTFCIFGALAVCIVLIIFIATIMVRFDSTVSDTVKDKASVLTLQADDYIADTINSYSNRATFAAGVIAGITDEGTFKAKIYNIQYDSRLLGVKSIKYIKNGEIYESDGTVSDRSKEYASLVTKVSEGTDGFYGDIYDYNAKMNTLAFYATIDNNPNIDKVILFYSENIVTTAELSQSLADIQESDFVAVISNNGRIIAPIFQKKLASPLIDSDANTDFITQLGTSSFSSDDSDEIANLIKNNESGTYSTLIDGERIVITLTHGTFSDSMGVISLFRANNLDKSTDSVISSIGMSLIILFGALFLVVIVLFAIKRNSERKAKEIENYNYDLNCYSRKGIEIEIEKNLVRFKGSQFAVVGAQLKHYRYLKEKFPEKIDKIMTAIRDFINQYLELGELMGTGFDGEFIMLLHYTDQKFLINRLKNMSAVINKSVGTKEYNVRLDFGVFEVPKEENISITAHQMVTNAFNTIDADKANSSATNVNIYTTVFNENYMQSAEIEVKMDFALKNEEFKVFFQPKINATTNTLDSCEALVRWYDEKSEFYRPPSMFLPLFEENGFIVKLDKYVFTKTCEFIGARVTQGLPVYPTSVNISRITALSEGFMDYYANIKKQNNVPDNFIILEFTESIASASYGTLNTIANMLHKHNFLCSIDDYGSGYSSLNILKNINVDEVKMDRIFLEKGISAERDKEILASIVSLAKTLGIKVVQEGVETDEELRYVRDAGCEIIQGYYYSKPLPMMEYIEFMEKHTTVEQLREGSVIRTH